MKMANIPATDSPARFYLRDDAEEMASAAMAELLDQNGNLVCKAMTLPAHSPLDPRGWQVVISECGSFPHDGRWVTAADARRIAKTYELTLTS